MDDDLLLQRNQDDLTAIDAGEVLLAYAITIAEGKADQVPARGYRAAHRRLLRDPVARTVADGVLTRCTTPALLWGHLRSVATG